MLELTARQINLYPINIIFNYNTLIYKTNIKFSLVNALIHYHFLMNFLYDIITLLLVNNF